MIYLGPKSSLLNSPKFHFVQLKTNFKTKTHLQSICVVLLALDHKSFVFNFVRVWKKIQKFENNIARLRLKCVNAHSVLHQFGQLEQSLGFQFY